MLVVEDDPGILSMLTIGLRFLGFPVHSAGTGKEALSLARDLGPDVMLLDVGLPDMDGFEVCERLRESGRQTPVIFLTARDAVEDKIQGLTLGGDDYVTKPFDLNEVVARIHALLRRASRSGTHSRRRLVAGRVELDRDSREVWHDGWPVQLSATEFSLLTYLFEKAGQVVTRTQILNAVWGYDFHGNTGVVETYIYYLRRKLYDGEQRLIRTVRGAGYLVPQAVPAEA